MSAEFIGLLSALIVAILTFIIKQLREGKTTKHIDSQINPRLNNMNEKLDIITNQTESNQKNVQTLIGLVTLTQQEVTDIRLAFEDFKSKSSQRFDQIEQELEKLKELEKAVPKLRADLEKFIAKNKK